MVICLKVKTLDSHTYDFSVDDEISVRQFKETIAEKTNISADLQRIIYCGRVLSDEKLLKEYDVNGKVVHVVERPPPSSRVATNTTESTSRRPRRDGGDHIVRGSQLLRALDGMVVGAMTIPVSSPGVQPQATVPPLTPSSSFCMNRITVARHMLDCANNIASYLENPERGLNNSPLDILAQGRWTMESTVVEVGISGEVIEIPQNQTQNLLGALHGAVSSALRQSPNVTLLHIPTAANGSGTNASSTPSQGSSVTNQQNTENTAEQTLPETATSVDIPTEEQTESNVNEEDAEVPSTQPPPIIPQAADVTANQRTLPTNDNSSQEHPNTSTANNSSSGSPTRQRTGTRTLAEVIEQMTTVQNRLAPFINQYYEILLNDPVFEESDSTGLANAQRVFNRVSEALHYMAHAQHAISDLMLDLSQLRPRYLCCRPILVEQSGFVSANNIASIFHPSGGNNTESNGSNARSSAFPQQQRQQQQQQQQQQPSASTASNEETPNTDQTSGEPVTVCQNPPRAQQRAPRCPAHHRISSPTVARSTHSSSGGNLTPGENTNQENVNQANPQLQVARFIQAVVNSAPLDADLHVQINSPNLLTFGQPGQTGQQQQPQTQTTQTPPQANTNSSNGNTNNDSNTTSGLNQARVTTATHPTTATQTRSTSRPQVHVANIPSSQMWNTRVIPANMVSSFDRFLPCSSHHIRDNESNDGNSIHINHFFARPRSQIRMRRNVAHATATSPPRTTSTIQPESSNRSSTSDDFYLSSEIPINLFGNNITLRDLIDFTPTPSALVRIRSNIHEFIVNNLFGGAPISEENMNTAMNNLIQLLNDALIFLPQFELPDYDSRASVENFIRNTLPFMINLISEDNSNLFGMRLLREIMNFIHGLIMVIVTCVGRTNAELYMNQIAQMALNYSNVQEEEMLRALQRYLMSAFIREVDITLENAYDVQEYLVIRRPSAQQNQNNEVTPMETDDQPIQSEAAGEERAIDVPESIAENQASPVPIPTSESSAPLPTVVLGSQPWHNNFPSNWLPIITRDIEKQRRQSPQGPFSDAYISGMSAKRRKLVTNSKPPTDIPSLITDGARRAIQAVGIPDNSSSVTAEEISTAIGTDPAVETAYREAMRSSVQERLRTDSDFTPDKFPNSSKYFNN